MNRYCRNFFNVVNWCFCFRGDHHNAMKVNGSSLGCWARYSIVVAVFTWLLVLFLITKGVFRQDSNGAFWVKFILISVVN